MSHLRRLHASVEEDDVRHRHRARQVLLALVAGAAGLVGVGTVAPSGAEVVGGVDFGEITPGPNDVLVGPTPADTTLQVTLGLRRDQAALEAFARAVSDPASPEYGKYVGVAVLASRYGVAAEGWRAIDEYFSARAIEFELDATGAFALGLMTVEEAQHVFGVSFNSYNDTVTEDGPYTAIYPDGTPSLPPELTPWVDLVRGISQFGVPAPGSDAATDGPGAGPDLHPGGGGNPAVTGTPAGCPDGIDFEPGQPLGFTPNQFATAYEIDALHGAGFQGQGVHVAVAGDSGVTPSDVTTFAECFNLPSTPFFVSNPAQVPDNDVENTGDVEAIVAVAPALDRLDMVVAPLATPESFDLTLFVWMLSGPLDATRTGGALPDIISISFGSCEPAWQEQGELTALTEFVLATGVAAGTSWFLPGGDNGSSDCQSVPFVEDPNQRATDYPSSSVWVTAVGGTNLALADDNTIESQGVWNDVAFGLSVADGAGAGGGGESALWPRPSWQLGPGVPAGTGRLMPDVSFYGAQFPGRSIYWSGECQTSPEAPTCWTSFNGTSNATPTMAGVAALVLQAGREQGLPTLGLLTPLLYELGRTDPEVFRDITIGTNDLLGVGCCAATPGFDLASGWGTVRASALAEALRPPVAAIDRPETVDPGGRARFSAARATTPGGTLVRYAWDVGGDGSVEHESTIPEAELELAGPGPTEVVLTVTNSLGRSASARTTVRVTGAVGPVTRAAAAVAVHGTPTFTG